MAINILFICTGNTCRSPMAAGFLSHLIPTERKAQYGISSAGLHAVKGLPASDPAIQVMKEAGIDISGHRAQPITQDLVEKADLILAMSESHAEKLKDHYPEASGKIFLLSDYADKGGIEPGRGIPDPIGAPMEIYRDTRDQIKKYVNKIANKM